MKRESLAMLIGAIIAVLAQVIIAPNIVIFSAMPNFLLAFALVVAIVRPQGNSALVIAFTFGLIYDLLGHAPVGAMAFLLVLAAFVVSRLFTILSNETLFMPLVTFAIAALLVEVLYAVFMMLFGITASPMDAFVQRALPNTLLDCAVGLVFYLLAARFLIERPASSSASQGAPAHTSVQVSTQGQHRISKSKKKMPRF